MNCWKLPNSIRNSKSRGSKSPQSQPVEPIGPAKSAARQQLESGALVIPPLDVSATANALHQALIMPADERKERAERLRSLIEMEDIDDWLCKQLETVVKLGL